MIRKNAGFALLEGMTAYNEAVARDPMNARNEFLKGIGVPPAKGS